MVQPLPLTDFTSVVRSQNPTRILGNLENQKFDASATASDEASVVGFSPAASDEMTALSIQPYASALGGIMQIFTVLRSSASFNPTIVESHPLAKRFSVLVSGWKKKTEIAPSLSIMVSDPHYLSIIGMGSSVVPYILKELQESPDYWFSALEALTGENPVEGKDVGDLKAMTAAWLHWGKDHDIVY